MQRDRGDWGTVIVQAPRELSRPPSPSCSRTPCQVPSPSDGSIQCGTPSTHSSCRPSAFVVSQAARSVCSWAHSSVDAYRFGHASQKVYVDAYGKRPTERTTGPLRRGRRARAEGGPLATLVAAELQELAGDR